MDRRESNAALHSGYYSRVHLVGGILILFLEMLFDGKWRESGKHHSIGYREFDVRFSEGSSDAHRSFLLDEQPETAPEYRDNCLFRQSIGKIQAQMPLIDRSSLLGTCVASENGELTRRGTMHWSARMARLMDPRGRVLVTLKTGPRLRSFPTPILEVVQKVSY